MYTQTVIGGEVFELSSQYEPGEALGHGSCGTVISCTDKSSNQKVAIKKIANLGKDTMMSIRALREIKLLKLINHKNLVRFVDIMKPSETAYFDEIYIVQELMDTHLGRVIKSPQPLTKDHVKCFMWQLLNGLQYLHAANVIHRDIKPANILVNADCTLKICDFGLATNRQSHMPAPLTEYVVTRWYRSPEVVLSCSNYDAAVDVWSAGCVMAELLQRRVLFPGSDSVSQMKMICEKLGKPNDHDLSFIRSDPAKRFVKSMCGGVKSFREYFPFHSDDTLEMLEAMLKFNPGDRITAANALSMPYFDGSRTNIPILPDFDFCDYCDTEESVGIDSLRELIWAELRDLHVSLPLGPPLNCALNDTDVELDDSSDAESHLPCHILGFMPPREEEGDMRIIPTRKSVATQKRPWPFRAGIGFAAQKKNNGKASPKTSMAYLHQASGDIQGSSFDYEAEGMECEEGDNSCRDSFSSAMTCASDDDDHSMSSCCKPAIPSEMPPPHPVVAHHLVDTCNPFSSIARRHQRTAVGRNRAFPDTQQGPDDSTPDAGLFQNQASTSATAMKMR